MKIQYKIRMLLVIYISMSINYAFGQGYIGMTLDEIKNEIRIDNQEGYNSMLIDYDETLNESLRKTYSSTCTIKRPDDSFHLFFSKNAIAKKRHCILSILKVPSRDKWETVKLAFNMTYIKKGNLEWECMYKNQKVSVYGIINNDEYCFMYQLLE